LAIGSANQVLAVNTGATAPQYVSQSTLSVGTATNIAGGVAGSVPYNTGAGATSFLSIGTAGQVLIVNSGATAPQYTAQSSLSVGTATNIAGGTANQIPYQTGAGATSFVTAPTVSSTYLQWNGTSFVWAAASGGGGTTTNALTIGTGLSGTSFNGSAAVTIAIDSTVVTLTGTQTLTNKTLTSPTIGTILNTGTLTLPTSTDTLVGRATTDTLTNKRIDPRVVATTTAATLTPSIATADVYAYTALAANLTINIPSGTPVDGDKLMFRFLDNGTSRNLTWNITSTGYTAIGVTLPTATTANKTTYVGCIYNANNTRWDVIAVTTQA
jgi:hypothetical protein